MYEWGSEDHLRKLAFSTDDSLLNDLYGSMYFIHMEPTIVCAGTILCKKQVPKDNTVIKKV